LLTRQPFARSHPAELLKHDAAHLHLGDGVGYLGPELVNDDVELLQGLGLQLLFWLIEEGEDAR
jgi:hypothetical protein